MSEAHRNLIQAALFAIVVGGLTWLVLSGRIANV